ncbi:hypothetical protein G5I_07460 [Acromyrmex echinatior]|uniref:Uncharacterized protein n=1 Tax=Acromyrmex echinatior TaxID=103372 RepID=F4WNV3_ACREC|nr:hypothetical protein G5I_07460 [Acromyrmex echinatior]
MCDETNAKTPRGHGGTAERHSTPPLDYCYKCDNDSQTSFASRQRSKVLIGSNSSCATLDPHSLLGSDFPSASSRRKTTNGRLLLADAQFSASLSSMHFVTLFNRVQEFRLNYNDPATSWSSILAR